MSPCSPHLTSFPLSGDCVPSPCHNGGTCLEEEEGARCLCLPGYGGDLCDVGECVGGGRDLKARPRLQVLVLGGKGGHWWVNPCFRQLSHFLWVLPSTSPLLSHVEMSLRGPGGSAAGCALDAVGAPAPAFQSSGRRARFLCRDQKGVPARIGALGLSEGTWSLSRLLHPYPTPVSLPSPRLRPAARSPALPGRRRGGWEGTHSPWPET